jgi:hypothetical protein
MTGHMGITRKGFLRGLGGAALLGGWGLPRARAEDPALNPKMTFPLLQGDPVPSDELRQLAGYLKTYRPPEGALPAEGGWTAVYDIVHLSTDQPKIKKKKKEKVTAAPSVMANMVCGQVAVTRGRGAPEYRVRMQWSPTPAVENVEALLRCNADAVASLRDYEMTWSCASPVPGVAYTRRETGTVRDGALEVVAGSLRDSFELKHPLACLWTLFDAVRHLPEGGSGAGPFDMHMDLSSLRCNQTLAFSGKGRAPAADGPLEVAFYRQLGVGIQPIHYAVDSRRRTLFATQGQLGWALNRIGGAAS